MRMIQESSLSPSTSFPYPMNRKEETERALTTLSLRMALSGSEDLQILCYLDSNILTTCHDVRAFHP